MALQRRVQLAIAALAALLGAGLLWPNGDAGSMPASQQGVALWRGELPLTARIDGHVQLLPASAARCVNCHGGAGAAPDPATGRDPLDGVAPVLTARHLREPRSRRGGPPSRYDAASFCTLLRTGVDPAQVVLPRHMPRYEITEADCAALWSHLTRKPA